MGKEEEERGRGTGVLGESCGTFGDGSEWRGWSDGREEWVWGDGSYDDEEWQGKKSSKDSFVFVYFFRL